VANGLRDFDFGEKDIGVFLMESITTGLYKNPMNVLREYISNEIDNDPAPSEIELRISGNSVVVRGDGPGMDFQGIRDAVKVGFSPKELGKNIGFRGIGIYSGVAVCDKIRLTTKMKGNPDYYLILVDCRGLRENIKNAKSLSLIESLKENVKWDKRPAPPDKLKDHGTAVELIDILDDFQELLQEKEVRKFCEMVVPVEFDPGCPYGEAIGRHLKTTLGRDYRIVSLTLEGSRVYRAPKYVALDKPIFGKIADKKRTLAVYWICQNSRPGQITDELSRGLVYRKKGFTVGDRTTIARLFLAEKNKHLIDYITGEIHIIAEDLLPNTERVEFEASPTRDIVEREIVETIGKEISKISRTKSAVLKAEERIEKSQSLENTPKFEDHDDWLNQMTEVKRLQQGLRKDCTNKYVPPSIQANAERAKKRVDAWIKNNKQPPTTKTEITQQEEAEEEETEVKKTEEKPEKEHETTDEWVGEVVGNMCARASARDSAEIIAKIVVLMIDQKWLQTRDQVKDFLERLEMRMMT
jgi:molecular chaperone HtpG